MTSTATTTQTTPSAFFNREKYVTDCSVGGIGISLCTPFQPVISGDCEKFITEEKCAAKIDYLPCRSIKMPPHAIMPCGGTAVGEDGARYYFEQAGDDPYAMLSSFGNYRTVYYTDLGQRLLKGMKSLITHCAAEEILRDNGRYILHSAFVEHCGGGLLFSGPSQAGKTTQAMLWRAFRDSLAVNGDRAVLSVDNGIPTAHGFIFSGSSGFCENRFAPISAIVFPEKASSCSVRAASRREAVVRLFCQLTVNVWDDSFKEAALAFLEKLTESVPVYIMKCTPDEDAVRCLERLLS